eukprot:gene4244-14357_t
MENNGEAVPLELETLEASRRMSVPIKWHNLEEDEFVTSVSGNYTRSHYLCHFITFHLNSGRVIERGGEQMGWMGERFTHTLDVANGGRLLGLHWDISAPRSGVGGIIVDKPT